MQRRLRGELGSELKQQRMGICSDLRLEFGQLAFSD
jgi:hypothetical protein